MRRGLVGYKSDCDNEMGAWGTSINCPNPFLPGEDVLSQDGIQLLVGKNGPAYIPANWKTETPDGDFIHHATFRPALWEPQPDGRVWKIYAVKVPTSYPYGSCEKYPPISSAEDGGDGTFQIEICDALEHVHYEDLDVPGVFHDSFRKGVVFCHRSRAIYTDGRQTHLCYCMTGKIGGFRTVGETSVNMTDWFFQDLSGFINEARESVGDPYILDIAARTKIADYRVFSMGGHTGLTDGADPTYMEFWTSRMPLPRMFDEFSGGNQQIGINNIQCAIQGMILSGYTPGSIAWSVSRILYEGDRLGDPGLEVFASPGLIDPIDLIPIAPDLGKEGTVYDGDYVIVLPSRTVAMDSAVENDWGWVIAMTLAGTKKIICSRWHSSVYRTVGDPAVIGDGTQYRGFADGTLDSSEVTIGLMEGNLILDMSDPPDGYDVEELTNWKIRCYNRPHDATTGKPANCAILTSQGEDVTTTAEDVIADFEQPGGFEPDYFDNGLPDGMHFVNSGTGFDGNSWLIDNQGIFPDLTNPIGGSFHANNGNQSVVFQGTADLSLSFIAVTAGTVKVKFRLGNRTRSVSGPAGEFSPLTNFPNPNNVGQFWLNGVLQQTVDMIDYPVAASIDTDFTTTYEFTYTVPAGTQTIRITAKREDAYDELNFQVDEITFDMPIMLGSDINGVRRWYSVGGVLREFTQWAWAKRDEEDETAVASRSATLPDFITLDDEGCVIIGNRHFTVRLFRDGSVDTEHGGPRGEGFSADDTGYVRWTASPNIPAPVPPCFEPDDPVPTDSVADGPWGAFFIAATGHRAYQVRGVNAALRDSTVFPFNKRMYSYKHPVTHAHLFEDFRARLNVTTNWAQRASSWTVSKNGQELEPHIEVIWRPSLHLPAWPEATGADGEWPSPPYRSNFRTSTDPIPWGEGSYRVRNPLSIGSESLLTRWGLSNLLIPRTYSDAWSRIPQPVWAMYTYDPPDDEGSPLYWHPDWPPESVPEGLPGGPWGSAKWWMMQARHNPNGYHVLVYGSVSTMLACSAETGDSEENSGGDVLVTSPIKRASFADYFYSPSDYDVVYPSGNCACCKPLPDPPEGPPDPSLVEVEETAAGFTEDGDSDYYAMSEAGDILAITNVDPITDIQSSIDVVSTLAFDLLADVKSVRYIEVVSVTVQVWDFDAPITAHKLEVFISDGADEPVTTNDKTLMLSAGLPLSEAGGEIEYFGVGQRFLYPSNQLPGMPFKLRVRYSATLDNVIDENHVTIRVTDLLCRAYGSTNPPP